MSHTNKQQTLNGKEKLNLMVWKVYDYMIIIYSNILQNAHVTKIHVCVCVCVSLYSIHNKTAISLIPSRNFCQCDIVKAVTLSC